MDRDAFARAAQTLGLELSAQQLDQLEFFEDALYRANEVMNLTRVPKEEAWQRHFLDSLLFQEVIPTGSSVLDVGTGPGFPAWPLACARPDLQVNAADSSGKMIGFLIKQPLPNLLPIQVRLEDWDQREAFDVITGRAVAPLPIQLELSAPFAKVGGLVLPMRTVAEEEAIRALDASQLGLKLREVQRRAIPGTEVVRLIPIFEKVRSTPKQYPRTWAEIKRKPIG